MSPNVESPDCLFCKIIQGQIPAKFVYQTENILAFEDIHPQAPTHVLFIPKKHTDCLTHALDTHQAIELGEILQAVARYAQEQDLQDYRVVINNGSGAGQSVFHLHCHLLAGRSFVWPPG